MILSITSETKNEWSARFDADLEMTQVFYNGKEVTKRIIGRCWEDVLYKRFEEVYDLFYERFLFVHHID